MEAQEHLERLEDPLGGTESHITCSFTILIIEDFNISIEPAI